MCDNTDENTEWSVNCVCSGDQRDVYSELSALRRQLRSEQKRLEGLVQQGDWEDLDSPLSDRSGLMHHSCLALLPNTIHLGSLLPCLS